MDFVFSQADIVELTSPAAFAAAVPYVARDTVELIDLSGHRYLATLVAEVTTPAGEVVGVAITCRSIIGGVQAAGVCQRHPEGDCEHVAALLVALAARTISVESLAGYDPFAAPSTSMEIARAGIRPSGKVEQPIPPWQRVLDAALGRPRDVMEDAALLVELHLDNPKGGSWSGVRPRKLAYLAARPGTRGARGTWIRGQATWNRLAESLIQPAQVEVLSEFAGLYRASAAGAEYARYHYGLPDWIPLDALPSRGLWDLLDAVREAGIPLVYPSKSQPEVVLDDRIGHARFDAGIARNRLRVGAVVELEGEDFAAQHFGLLGSPAVGVAWIANAGTTREALTLARTAEPIPAALRDMLFRSEPISVAGTHREEFERAYLPRLQQLAPVGSSDATYEPPAPPRPHLELTIQHETDRVRLAWRFQYGRPHPLRDRAAESEILTRVTAALGPHSPLVEAEPSGDLNAPLPALELIRADAARFVAEVLPRLRLVIELQVIENGTARDYRAASASPIIAVTPAEDGLGPMGRDWLDLAVSVTVDGEKVPFVELFAALVDGDRAFLLPSGTFFPIDGEEFERLREIIQEAKTLNDRPVDRLRVSRYQVDLWQELVELGVVDAQATAWQKTVAGLSDFAVLEQVEPTDDFTATLRDYQSTGLSWMHFLRTNGLGGVLADDMGLGKTVQALAMIAVAREEQGEGMPPFLVVAPTSVVSNWVSECARFAPNLKAIGITETTGRRGATLAEAVAGAQIVVTSYALFRIEFDAYQDLEWSGLLLDEAQLIKNHTSRGYRCARLLDVPFKLAITGTPLENNLLELWALVSLTCPGLLGGVTHFTEFYRTPIERERDSAKLATLQRRISPFLLRRTKEQVASDLPEKQEQVLELELHPAHRKLYDLRLQRERQKVLGLAEDVDANRFQIFRSLTMLRQLALDASLVSDGKGSDDGETDGEGGASSSAPPKHSPPSAKLEMLVELLTEAAAEGHRTLVFSQFTRFLGKARDLAAEVGLSYAYLDGSTPRRAEQIQRFKDGHASVFFVSLKAGGFGLNLTEADYCILLDPWWNPASEAQAIDRTHRIGQTRNVMVYRLVAQDTIEQKVIALQAGKARLFSDVLDSEGAEVSTLSADDIRALLA